ncbi:hypothetical protein ACQ4PT_054542 [Festuca glaucescens]
MAGGDHRLSELPDDLLRRILHFAPLKEAASTTALSRRWRAPLWLSSGAVNLETTVTRVETWDHYRGTRRVDEAGFLSRRSAFVSAAVAALDAATAATADDEHVKRLTLRLESDRDAWIGSFLNRRGNEDRNLVDVVLSHRAARRVEELRLRLEPKEWSSDADDDNETYRNHRGLYTVTLDVLPSQTLRVLELTNCTGLNLPEATAIVLPRLSSLQLRHCAQDLNSLSNASSTLPRRSPSCTSSLSSSTQRKMHLHKANTEGRTGSGRTIGGPGTMATAMAPGRGSTAPHPKEAASRGLRCPAATVLVLDRCKWEEKDHDRNKYGYHSTNRDAVIDMVIHAPGVRYRLGFTQFDMDSRYKLHSIQITEEGDER